MKSHALKAGALAFFSASFMSTALAAPPADSPYQTDPQQSYVEDATSQGIGEVNMIACIMSAMRPDALVNEGSYVALIDKNKCDQDKRVSGDAGQAAASYITAVVNSSRASNSDPMIAKMWLELDEEGMHTTIYVRISATEAPSTANPYGVFRLDFCGLIDNDATCKMNGFVEGTADGLRYYQVEGDGSQSNTVAMRLATVGTTSGSGRMLMDDGQNQAEFSFAYNPGLFLRSDGTDDQCFSRDASDPDTGLSVWRYGLYDGLTGQRITRNSGFPIEYATGGTTYHGYLGYFGLSLPPEAANSLQNGATVEKVDYSAGDSPTRTSYTAVRAGGKLVKYSKKSRTLAEIDHVKFTTFVGNDANPSFFAGAQPNVSYEMYWDDVQKKFVVTGQMQCGNQGCQTIDLAQDQIVGVSYWSARGGIQGSSQSLGGELFINVGGLVDPVASAAVAVVYRTQDLVYPSQLPTTLYCVQNCPTADTLADYFAPGSVAQSPYTPATYNSFSSTLLANVVTYGTDATSATLRDGVNEAVVFTEAEAYGEHPFYQYGVRSGRLVENLAAVECSNGSGTYCDWKASNMDVYYQWETGPNAWNQFTGVKNGSGDFVAFDPPLQVTFNVPDTAAYGESAGSSIVLQYGGFGDLWGIPGHCVSRLTNEEVSCVEQESRYVPAFVIPANETVGHVTDGSNTYLVKWLNREIRFAKKDVTNFCSAQGLTAPTGVILPTAADLRNPSSASSDIYIGTKPVVTAAPRVIHGEVKY